MKKTEFFENYKGLIVLATGIILCAGACFGYKAYEKHQRQAAVEASNKAMQHSFELLKQEVENYNEVIDHQVARGEYPTRYTAQPEAKN